MRVNTLRDVVMGDFVDGFEMLHVLVFCVVITVCVGVGGTG